MLNGGFQRNGGISTNYIKSKHPEQNNIDWSDESSLSFGVAPNAAGKKEHMNSPPDKASPRFGRTDNQNSLGSSTTVSPSLSNVRHFVNSRKEWTGGSSYCDIAKSCSEEENGQIDIPQKHNCVDYVSIPKSSSKAEEYELNPCEDKGRLVESPERTPSNKPFLYKSKLIKEIKANLSRPNRDGVERRLKVIGSAQRGTGQHPTVLLETDQIIGSRNHHLITYFFVRILIPNQSRSRNLRR